MNYQEYSGEIESHFQKLEYITIAHTGAKMLSSPKRPFKNGRLFCFVANGVMPSDELIKKLVDYSRSIAYYDDPCRKETIAVITLFISDSLPEAAKKTILHRPKTPHGVLCVPASFELSQERLTVCSQKSFFSYGAFSALSGEAKKILKPKM